MLDNTWIVYNSDHGEMLGDHRMSHKIVFYEEAVNIPCLFRPPGGVRGWKSAGLTDQLDVVASLLDIAGAKPLPDSESRSLVPQVSAGPEGPTAQTGKPAVFSEVYGFSMVRDERFKLVVQAETWRPVEMFDTVNDPRELRNLVKDPGLEAVRRELIETPSESDFLNAWIRRNTRFSGNRPWRVCKRAEDPAGPRGSIFLLRRKTRQIKPEDIRRS